ncbi:MAG: transglutaminase family protein [Xanthobacteraceae bacterium]|nr:MAG: transglutaminase family protein [Xanthobacteraceae bacterium]
MHSPVVPPETLKPSRFIQSDDPAIVAFARAHTGGETDPVKVAINLYFAVRDGIIYDPYVRFNAPESYSAKDTLAAGRGFCVPKAALLAACARAVGIPARLGFADVRNHLATPKLLAANGGDIMRWHAFTEMFLDGRWVKSTPAFNLTLCERFGVHPLDWDGQTDSVFQPFDTLDRKHMEYVNERGSFADVPIEAIFATFLEHSPRLLLDDPFAPGSDFAAEAVTSS